MMRLTAKKILSMCMILVFTLILVACGDESYLNEAIQKVEELLLDVAYEDGDTFELISEYKKVNISWYSVDEDIINQEGNVNAVGLREDYTAEIEVTFTEGKKEEVKSFFVEVLKIEDVTPGPGPGPDPIDENKQKIETVKAFLTQSFSRQTETKEDLALPLTSNGVTLKWTSNHSAVLVQGEKGIVARSEEETIEVTLSVELSIGDAKDSLVFKVKVLKEEVLLEAKTALDIAKSTDKNLSLPQVTGTENKEVTITWLSSDEEIITNDGKVTRDLSQDKQVTMIATMTYKGQTETKEFSVTVLKDPTLSDALELLKTSIDANVVRDLSLIKSIGQVNITWVSSHPQVVSAEGIVLKGTEDVNVTLTATLTYKGISAVEVFNVTVKKTPSQKLMTPINGVNHTVANKHIAIGPYNYSGTGYSGQMRVLFTNVATGEIFAEIFGAAASASVGISYTYKLELPAGTYTLKYQALGDGLEYDDSLYYSHPVQFTITWPTLPSLELTKTDTHVLWQAVAEATSYEIYFGNILQATLDESDILEFILPTQAGIHTVKVIAKAEKHTDSSASITHTVASENAVTLNAPVVTKTGSTISWSAVSNASKYEIEVGITTKIIDLTSIDLESLDLNIGTYQVTVRALGDAVNFKDSAESNTVEYVVTAVLDRLNVLAVSDFVSSYLLNGVDAGHRKLEIYRAHDVFKQTGWSDKIKIGIRVNGEMIYETFNFSGAAMVMLHTPNNTSSFFGRNLPAPGKVELHLILVGNGTTHRDSLPLILEMNWAIK